MTRFYSKCLSEPITRQCYEDLDVSISLRSLAKKTGTRRAFSTSANSPIDAERESLAAISMLFGGHTRT